MMTLALAALLASQAHAAGQAPPLAHATLSPDGQYSLIIQPDSAWKHAEFNIMGDGCIDVGPAEEDQHVRVDGWTDQPAPLRVTVHAATPDERGITWTFQVDPELVPVAAPEIERAAPRKRFLGLFRHRQ